jgi:hypothetical protein
MQPGSGTPIAVDRAPIRQVSKTSGAVAHQLRVDSAHTRTAIQPVGDCSQQLGLRGLIEPAPGRNKAAGDTSSFAKQCPIEEPWRQFFLAVLKTLIQKRPHQSEHPAAKSEYFGARVSPSSPLR